MYEDSLLNLDRRRYELERTLSRVLELFQSDGDTRGYTIETLEGLVEVSADVNSIIEDANNLLIDDEDN